MCFSCHLLTAMKGWPFCCELSVQLSACNHNRLCPSCCHGRALKQLFDHLPTISEPVAQVHAIPATLQVPGLLPCLLQALEADNIAHQLGDVAPLAWFILNLALHVPGARADTVLHQFIEPLQSHGGAAGSAAQQLRVLLASAGTTGRAADVLSGNNGSGSSNACEATAMQVDAVMTSQVCKSGVQLSLTASIVLYSNMLPCSMQCRSSLQFGCHTPAPSYPATQGGHEVSYLTLAVCCCVCFTGAGCCHGRLDGCCWWPP